MKKQWISVKCGLSRDPKHRRQMGKSVWTFLHMLDLADWETGIVYDWKDENAAEDMGIDIRVLREDRRKLDEEGYITCKQKQYGQDIFIHNWTNPREYSGEVRNQKPQSGKKSPPSDSQGDAQGYAQGSVKDVTPTSNSKNKEQLPAGAVFKKYQDNIAMLTPTMSDKLQEAENTYPAEWIVEAIDIAVVNNKRNWGYCEAILKRWKSDGKDAGKKMDIPQRKEGVSSGYFA